MTHIEDPMKLGKKLIHTHAYLENTLDMSGHVYSWTGEMVVSTKMGYPQSDGWYGKIHL